MTAHENRQRLRTALASTDVTVAPGVFDGISAHLVRLLEFAAAYMTGAGVAASGFGLPDIGLVTQTEMVERARMLVSALGDVPLIADADTGYGAELSVIRTVREFESAGVAAIQLEDQAFPKKCGHLPDKELISTDAFVKKLEAALDARTDSDLILIARTDARGPLGIAAAIDRANAYAAAGADMIFVEAPQGADEVERIANEVSAPLLINLVIGGLTPIESSTRLTDLGYAVAIHPSLPLGAAAFAMLTGLAGLAGRDPAPLLPSTPAEFFDLVGLAEWSELAELYRTKGE
ncbi:isocitrate lyase/PEP mutase family protein [Antrihabitans stalactiti]|uniref:Isocitrate lyase/PEP mutase family protein n=1 Tax=Antrihabitans stalactiti TaxID=2584121 RepID=A0A848KL84_9NOCA|nr:isocitrate lyase/PEP mutase family protein [Antrihabitans stalactiti]NMN99029.1 isocitrate lyase/PEP mutase family protein [Antrihabitans stalactiti]